MPSAISGTSPLALVLAFSALIMQPLEFAVPTYLLASASPQRENHVRRCVAAYMGIAAFNMVIAVIVSRAMVLSPTSPARYAVNAVSYALYLVVLAIAARHCFEMNRWNALFCATAGYTIQNLGSGTGELVRLLIVAATGRQLGDLGTALCSDASIVLMIVIYYFVYIRYARRIGRLGDDSRSMLGMLVFVIMVVITFDVVIRGLEHGGAQLGFLISLRVVHVAVCMFVLYAEWEAIVNARLRTEVSTRTALAAERERQYELSRETISAVNRRVHDIRHQVFRDLASSEARIEKDVLAAVARDIAVYDTAVRTGNEVIDTILTEKRLLLQKRGIALSCIVDGTALASLSAADLYALFGSLLDEAADAVCELEDTKLRSISLTLRGLGNLAVLHLEHYAGGGSAGGRYAQAREIVERLGGTFSCAPENGSLTIDAMIPVG